ncbi:hypothetical protein [Paenibacillus ehimensis]|nr:hypothetical protein [Paenibacillus ehimensis]
MVDERPEWFCFYKGKYHFFYQHYPYKPYWGPMHWDMR